MLKNIIILIGLIIIGIGVIAIFDARKIATKLFNQGETNNATRTLKIVGFILFIIGAIIIIIS